MFRILFLYFCVITVFHISRSHILIRIEFHLLGFCVKDNPNESMDLELLLPNDEIFRVRALSIKKFHEDYKKISPKGLIFAFCDFILIFSFISSPFFGGFFLLLFFGNLFQLFIVISILFYFISVFD